MGVYRPKGRKYFLIDFRYKGARILKRTKFAREEDAKLLATTMLTEMEKAGYGFPLRPTRITLTDFLKNHFLSHCELTKKAKPNTLDYYRQGVRRLLDSGMANLQLSSLTTEHFAQYIAAHESDSPSTINRDLRTLRKALYKAQEWNMLDKVPNITLLEETNRKRVLTEDESNAYIEACGSQWKDCAITLLGLGARPGEIYASRWENIIMTADRGIIQITSGKTKKAVRTLFMLPEVLKALRARHERMDNPTEGWVFPPESAVGHLVESSIKKWHKAALVASKVKPFPPYTLRHTAMTRLGALTPNACTLARIAGYSDIRTTGKYIHPQDDTIEEAFKKLAQKPPTQIPAK